MDGDKILFHSSNMGICYIDLKDETLHQMASWGVFNAPCWYTGVDTTFILYTQTGQLHMVDLDGREDRIQLGDDFTPGSLSYNRTKRKLTFNYHGIWVMGFYPEIEKAIPDIGPDAGR